MKHNVYLSDLFVIKYGSNLELNSLEKNEFGVNFVSRTSKNNGVSAKVTPLKTIDPIEPLVLTVACGGSVLETFLQEAPFYSGRDIACLYPKVKMLKEELLFYAYCIKLNKYKYSYGRQANKTLKNILLPSYDSIPSWVYSTNKKAYNTFQNIKPKLSQNYDKIPINTNNWKYFSLSEIFTIERGMSYYKKDLEIGNYPYISASSEDNGCSGYCNIKNGDAKSITLSYDGTVGEAFYQPIDFFASEKVAILKIKNKYLSLYTKYSALFICTILRQEKFKYNYGRKWSVNTKLKKTIIKLPANERGNIDWSYMNDYIRNIPFSN